MGVPRPSNNQLQNVPQACCAALQTKCAWKKVSACSHEASVLDKQLGESITIDAATAWTPTNGRAGTSNNLKQIINNQPIGKLLREFDYAFWSSTAARPVNQRHGRSAHHGRCFQNRSYHLVDGFGIRTVHKIPAVASISRKCMPVIFANFSFGNRLLQHISKRIHLLKICGPVREMNLHFLH